MTKNLPTAPAGRPTGDDVDDDMHGTSYLIPFFEIIKCLVANLIDALRELFTDVMDVRLESREMEYIE